MSLEMVTQLFLIGIVFVCGFYEVAATQPPDTLPRDLAFALPLVAIIVIVVVILIVSACVVYRARYGYFCCWKPRMSYRPEQSSSEHEGTDVEAERNPTDGNPDPSLPEYEPPERGLPPPDYRDALQDVIVSSGPTMHTESEEPAATGGDDAPAASSDEQQLPHPLATRGEDGEQREEERGEEEREEEERGEEDREEEEEAAVVPRQQEEDNADDDSTEGYDERTPLNP